MDVYTKEPKQLDQTAFSLFAGDGGVISPRKPQTDCQELKQKYSILGQSILSTEAGGEAGSEMNSMGREGSEPARRIRIPAHFLESERGRENQDRARGSLIVGRAAANGHSPENEMNWRSKNENNNFEEEEGRTHIDAPRESHLESNSSDESEVGGVSINRPSSKIIQDNQNLQKLFDSVRGKEMQVEQAKKVGKLRLPATFKPDDVQSRAEGRSKAVASEKMDGRTRNGPKMNDAVAMTFEEWKNVKERTDETFSFSKFGKSSDQRFETGFNATSSSKSLTKQSAEHRDTVLGSEANRAQAKMNAKKNYWFEQQKQVQYNDKDSYGRETEKRVSRMNLDDVNSATSRRGDERLCKTEFFKSDPDKRNSFVNEERTEADAVNGNSNIRGKEIFQQIPKSTSTEMNGEDKQVKTVGKLRLPTAFASNKDNDQKDGSTKKRFDANSELQLENIERQSEDLVKKEENKASHRKQEPSQSGAKLNGRINSATGAASSSNDLQTLSNSKKDKERVTSEDQRDLRKPIGKLNIKSFFQQEDDEKEKVTNEEDSVIARSKAIFDKDAKERNAKQRGVGKLRLGSTKSERYEEIENLTPKGEVPSNISNQMKEQLERILQGRSESVSSQASSSSTSSTKRNDGKEVGRLSLSSISSLEMSLTSPKEREELSNRSLEDDASNSSIGGGSQEENAQTRVNSGSLECQLGSIFHRRSGEESSASSSVASSLNTSFNAGGGEQTKSQAIFSKEETEKKDRRKIITDAIKEKYGGSAENDEMNNGSKRKVVFEVGENRPVEQSKEDVTIETCDVEKHQAPVEDAKEEKAPNRRGKLAIPNIFGSTTEKKGNTALLSNVTAKSVDANKPSIPIGREQEARKGFLFAVDDVKETKEVQIQDKMTGSKDRETGEAKNTTNGRRKVNIPSNFLDSTNASSSQSVIRGTANDDVKSSDTDKVPKREKSVSQASKKVNFQDEVGFIQDNGISERKQARQATAGKLSLSLTQAFEAGDVKPKRPATPGVVGATKTGRIFEQGWKEVRDAPSIIEEDVSEERSKVLNGKGILKLEEDQRKTGKSKKNASVIESLTTEQTEFTFKSDEAEETEKSRRTVGKLSIPTLFK